MTTFLIDSSAYDLPLTVTCGQVFRWRREEDGTWLGIDGDTVYAFDPRTGECQTSGSEWQAKRYLGIEEDAGERIARLTRIDAGIGSVAATWSRLGLMRPESLTETILSFICSSNNHLARIQGMVNRLASTYGTAIDIAGRRLFAMPPLEAIAAIPESELEALGFGYRARFVVKAAQKLAEDPDWESRLRSHGYTAARQELLELPGIGRKVADCICLYGLGCHEAVPVDVHLWNAFRQRFKPHWIAGTLTDKRYREIGDVLRQRFGSDAGYVQLLLYFDRQTGSKRL
ncbi:MAG: hypothetical protein HONBIEJF_01110 [Fimbriimonadaceae bacterium]|nr:hypothetical protein [Fimbriimonadaceae bacterium]